VHSPRYSKNISTLYGFATTDSFDRAPDFEWRDSLGIKRTLRDLEGKVVIVNFWATWCVPCLVEMPALRDITKDFRDDSVVVIGITIEREGNIYDNVEQFHRSKGLNFQVIMDPQRQVYEPYTGMTGTAVPQTFFIDRDGYVQYRLLGEQTYDAFKDHLEALL
jgi:peroxiredoxin